MLEISLAVIVIYLLSIFKFLRIRKLGQYVPIVKV